MDKIWYRIPSKLEVIGRCGGDEKTEWPRRTDKSRTLTFYIFFYINENYYRKFDCNCSHTF